MRASKLPNDSVATAGRGGDGMRFLIAAFGDAGHVFPAIALGKALAVRGHEVVIETWEERRGAVEGAGLG
ncbi:MAG: glycosyltransferase, partial [Solirubrobacterales bacterium]